MKSWNIVLERVKELHREAVNGSSYLRKESQVDKSSIIDQWLRYAQNTEFTDLFSYVKTTQHENYLLIKYKDLKDIFRKIPRLTEDESLEEAINRFWNSNNGFYREARSVVICLKRMKLVLTPFRKFHNYGEGDEGEVEFVKKLIKNAGVFEVADKLDGSMQSFSYYTEEDDFVYAGSGALDPKSSWQLRKGMTYFNNSPGLQKMAKENPHLTFNAEFIDSKEFLTVIYKPEDEGLHLIGARCKETGRQLSYAELRSLAEQYGNRVVRTFNKTFEQILDDLKNLKAEDSEGYVVNIDGHYLKFKADDYVELNKTIASASVNALIKAVENNTLEDLVAKIPKAHQKRIETDLNNILNYVKIRTEEIETVWNELPKEDRRSFFEALNKNPKAKRNERYLNKLYKGENYSVLANDRAGSIQWVTPKEMLDYLEVEECEIK